MSRSTPHNLHLDTLAALDALPGSRTELFHQAVALAIAHPEVIAQALLARTTLPPSEGLKPVGIATSPTYHAHAEALATAFRLPKDTVCRLAVEALVLQKTPRS
jgi:hypothetical protein